MDAAFIFPYSLEERLIELNMLLIRGQLIKLHFSCSWSFNSWRMINFFYKFWINANFVFYAQNCNAVKCAGGSRLWDAKVGPGNINKTANAMFRMCSIMKGSLFAAENLIQYHRIISGPGNTSNYFFACRCQSGYTGVFSEMRNSEIWMFWNIQKFYNVRDCTLCSRATIKLFSRERAVLYDQLIFIPFLSLFPHFSIYSQR